MTTSDTAAARSTRWLRILSAYANDRTLLLLLGLVLLLPGLGLRDAWPPDEPRFALVARDMVQSGQWLIPRVGGELYPDKPPLFMWIAAIFYWITGSLRLAFLLPSLLAGLGTVALVHDLANRLWNRRIALYAGVLLLLTVQFTLQARLAQLDALLAFWTTLGLYGLIRHLLLGPRWGWYYVGWTAMGLGVITKGVGFLPIMLFLPWFLLRWHRPAQTAVPPARDTRWWLGPLLMIAAIGAWLVPMLLYVAIDGSAEAVAYRNNILWQQTAERYANSWHHIRPAWYYVVEVLPWAWLPLTLILPWLIPLWWRRLKQGDPATWLLLGWVACVLTFFSLSAGKRGVYMLPTAPAIVLAAAPLLPDLLRRRSVDKVFWVAVASLAAAAWISLLLIYVVMPERAAAVAERHDVTPWGLIVAFAVIATTLTILGRHRRGLIAFALLLASLWQILGWWGYPMFNATRSGDALMRMTQEAVPTGTELGLVRWEEQFLLHIDRPVHHFGFRRDRDEEIADAVAWLNASADRRLMLPAKALEPCFDPQQVDSIAFRHRREWVIAGSKALTGACTINSPPRYVRVYNPRTGTATNPLEHPRASAITR